MSENWLVLIPADPHFIPDAALQHRARDHVSVLAPEANKIDLSVHDHVSFFDCGTNFERVICPSCDGEISMEWWTARMDEDYDDGFRLSPYTVPCCGASHDLNSLSYDWPQGFARFGLKALDSSIGELSDSARHEFEAILQTPLRVIYRHL